jgi:hypothetical protein
VKCFFHTIIDDTYEYPVETEDDHGADGDIKDDFGSEFVCAAPEVDNGKDGEETNNEIECDM